MNIGFSEDEVDTSASTRKARLKWVIVVNRDLPIGRIVNAATCVAAATAPAVTGLLGPDGKDADGSAHPGLPWAGCTILAADAETLRKIRASGVARDDIYVADMPLTAQETRVYDGYLERLAESSADEIEYGAVSLVGPRNPVDRLVGRLPLLT
ncbi:DUF2000 domain-containing protein [Kribbella sp. NPDC051587]|uniref:DUF2000 domain-containing protein n=1 Tax=Kribbella sp. NPDC051587 TaxID=3364119 RepID=UPI0037B13580